VTVANNANQNEDKGLDVSPPKDEDPDGMKLLTAPDGLDVAAKFLEPLVTHAGQNIDFWVTSYDVAIRRST
jgi:N-alpha-acetyltransferase 15/16, NatA auxiliary subunit